MRRRAAAVDDAAHRRSVAAAAAAARIRAGEPAKVVLARDLVATAEALLASAKNCSEHSYGVRSVVESLAPFCSSLEAPAEPSVLHLPNVSRLATDIRGRLAADTSLLELTRRVHPTAAVCGEPFPQALPLIDALEGMDRGRYLGRSAGSTRRATASSGWRCPNGTFCAGLALVIGRSRASVAPGEEVAPGGQDSLSVAPGGTPIQRSSRSRTSRVATLLDPGQFTAHGNVVRLASYGAAWAGSRELTNPGPIRDYQR